MPQYFASPAGLIPSRDTQEANTDAVRLAPGSYPQGQCLGEYTAGAAANEVQTLTETGPPTGGTFRLAFNGQVTAPIAYNAAAADVAAALGALPNVGAANVVGGGGPFPGTPITATLQGALGNQNQPPITLFSNSLTGGTNPTVAVAETTPGRAAGAYYGAYDDTATDGRQTNRAFLKYATTVDEQGNHNYAGGGNSPTGSVEQTSVAYFAGTFYTAKPDGTANLVGLDAAGVADVGRMIVGTTAALLTSGNELRMS